MPRERIEAEIAVVGAGGAGLYAALTAARAGARVALVNATPLARTASYWAQGGLAAALAADDSPDRHREDTEIAGRGLVRTSAAAVLCRDAPRAVADLERLGVHFDVDSDGNLALGLEGGHSRRRVVHAGGSATGRRVVRELSDLVVQTPGIEVLEGSRAAVLWTVDGRCVGVVCEDGRRGWERSSPSGRLPPAARCDAQLAPARTRRWRQTMSRATPGGPKQDGRRHHSPTPKMEDVPCPASRRRSPPCPPAPCSPSAPPAPPPPPHRPRTAS
jgi:FAD binding domain-containing protein